MAPESLLAAVDLGSNSFRLEIGRIGSHQRIERVEYLKEMVRLGGGLNAQNALTREAMERGWACLARFGERLTGFAPAQVCAVATQTLREARNRAEFIERGSELLGFPITIIPGEEEARLIYRGVASVLAPSQQRRLVIDIGGRSTEITLGQHSQALQCASFPLGSVSWSGLFFADGVLDKARFAAAISAAQSTLAAASTDYPSTAWDCAYASSGTAHALGGILTALGMDGHVITPHKLYHLKTLLLQAGHIDQLRLPALKEERRPVLAGGISVMLAVVEQLNITELEVTHGALRQGLLHDLLEHEPPADKEAAEILALQQDFGIDTAQAERVHHVATTLWASLCPAEAGDTAHDALRIAALLHEVGMCVALNDYHHHGAYILRHCAHATWSDALRQRISQLVLGHQGKLRKLDAAIAVPELALPLMALRLATQLCHARRTPELSGLTLSYDSKNTACQLQITHAWASAYPQSVRLLEQEVLAWSKTPWSLQLQRLP